MTVLRSALFLAIIVACGACQPDHTGEQHAATAAPAPAKAPTGGVDLAGIDHAVQPGDDFDGYANGAWRAKAEIPADRSSTGVFFDVFQKAEKRNAELIQDIAASHPAAGSDAARIADYYTAYMDQTGIEQRGLAPLQPTFDRIDAIASTADLARVLGETTRVDVDPLNATNYSTEHLFGLFVAQGLEDPTHNMAYLLQGGLGMPNRDYYLSRDPAMVGIRDKYKAYVAAMLRQAGIADSDAKAAAVYALEEKIAKAQASIVETEDVHKANNPWPVAGFAKKAPGLDWATYFKAAGLDGQTTIDAWQPDAIAKLSALTASQPLQAWKAWLAFHALNEHAAVLPKAFDDLSFGFYGTTLNGTPQQRDRWKRALSAVNNALGDAVGKLYVQKYFPASSRAQVQQMVSNLLAVFPERIDQLDWMSPDTKAKAKAKVAATKVGVGYPDTWRDYSALAIKPDDALGNLQRASLAETKHQLAKLGQPVDRGEWWMTPQTVNAVNLPLQNALNFPAAILEPPFFDPSADAAANYGSIGATIGHEISHSFDNTGAEFDAQGRLANWWTPSDAAHFEAAGAKLIAQYDAYEALPGLHLNGAQTLGENIADLAGLAVAHDAYIKSLGGKPAPVIDGLTGDQRFFLAFAQSWRSKTRDAALRAQVVSDGHAPGRFRAQTVRNIDAWYDAFAPKPGQALYLKPEDRVRIW
ncbi:M13 family metallopeptidase [Cognatiluteimonas telluris]|uniref:M13 family metallopeptidase n=1 Tax=Cognatiluteimonas telluris TaxID=1104775 RepID=UPI001408874D|nr:M13 family metallopeptidase [Lysobacter telluris]